MRHRDREVVGMGKWRPLVAGMVGAVLALGVGYGVQSLASSPPGPTTFYACLQAGTLTQVGVSAPTCPGGATQVSWNSYPPSASGTPQCTGIPHVGIDLSGCDLVGSNFTSDDLHNAMFMNANLQDANFMGANLSRADLSAVILTGANLYMSNLVGAQLSGASMSGVDGAQVSGPLASLPTNWQWIPDHSGYLGNLIGPGVVLKDIAFGLNSENQPTNLSDVDLGGAKVVSVDFYGTNLTGANFTGANMTGDAFDEVPVSGSGAPYFNPDLSDVNFTGTNLAHTVFRGAVFTGAIWSNTTCPDGTNSNNDGGTCVNNLTL
jgi:uncharacterized protein YjbI with pentapeptide repeats